MPSSIKLISRAFGLQHVRTILYKNKIQEDIVGNQYPVTLNSGSYDGNTNNWMGLPVFSDIEFPLPNGLKLKMADILITVNQQRNIIKTTIQGRSGTVKEYIADGDFTINIKGALVIPQSNDYPEALVRDLMSVLNLKEVIEPTCDYLRLFDIYGIVITGYSFPQQRGFQNVQLFEINALSDTPDLLVEPI